MTRFVLTGDPPIRVAVDGLIPERLAGLSTGEIERLPLQIGNRQERVGDWFRIAAGDDDVVEIEGSTRRLDRIGADMVHGRVVVEGDAGAYAGLGMRGGSLSVQGSAGFGAATALQGGFIRIAGDAGDAIGGSLPGAAGGMRGGIVLVGGRAGLRAGQRLRGGVVVVGGDVGTGCGSAMIGGTIVVGGTPGTLLGMAMRRGSIIGLGRMPGVGPTFVDCGTHEFVFLRILERQLAKLDMASLAGQLGQMRRFRGDLAVGGKGELLLLNS